MKALSPPCGLGSRLRVRLRRDPPRSRDGGGRRRALEPLRDAAHAERRGQARARRERLHARRGDRGRRVDLDQQVLGVKSFVQEANDGNATEDSSIRRESHGKAQGCLRAKVDVTTKTGAGVFKSGASYPAWIRLSNGGAYQKDDKSQHISRAGASSSSTSPETSTHTHDFLFITRRASSSATSRTTRASSSRRATGALVPLQRAGQHVLRGEGGDRHRLGLKVANLLESPEYSAVPYAYGKETVKYAVAPCGTQAPSTPTSKSPPKDASETYLEDAMNTTLAGSQAAGGVCYSMFVQKPRSNGEDSIENPTSAWEGAFEQVAKITIPFGQHRGAELDYRKNDAECERMAFDPFNTTEASHPIGRPPHAEVRIRRALGVPPRGDASGLCALAEEPRRRVDPVEYRNELKKIKDPSAPRSEGEGDEPARRRRRLQAARSRLEELIDEATAGTRRSRRRVTPGRRARDRTSRRPSRGAPGCCGGSCVVRLVVVIAGVRRRERAAEAAPIIMSPTNALWSERTTTIEPAV